MTFGRILLGLLVSSAVGACRDTDHRIPPSDPGRGRAPARVETRGVPVRSTSDDAKDATRSPKVVKSEDAWRRQLTPNQYHILREKGTEPAFTGKYWDSKAKGVYKCAGCGQPLYSSDTKFESGSGWPSFWAPLDDANIQTVADNGLGMHRTELLCRRCGGHLGHVFDDGPAPTGKRHCINSASLVFEERP